MSNHGAPGQRMLLPGELKTQENKWERETEESDPAENSKALTFHRAIISDLVDLIRHFIPPPLY